jgi:hypothetical protein
MRSCDSGDLNHGIRLAVAPATAHVFTPAELLNDDLLVSELIDNLAEDVGTLHGRRADRRFASVTRDQQDSRKMQLLSDLANAPVYTNTVTLADAKLMAAVLDDCIHPLLFLALTPQPRALEGLSFPESRHFNFQAP